MHLNTYLTFFIKLFHSESPEYISFEDRIKQLPNSKEIIDYCIKWTKRCNYCPCRKNVPATEVGRRKVIFGREMRACGPYYNIATTDFSANSLQIVKSILRNDEE